MTSPESNDPPAPDNGQLMYVKCAYCGAWMDVKPGHLNIISHGLCEACYAIEMKKLDASAESSD